MQDIIIEFIAESLAWCRSHSQCLPAAARPSLASTSSHQAKSA